jgi:UDP-GlcNAc:undecaprenyl-phosphate GlcNAc-1-phosphate transferase
MIPMFGTLLFAWITAHVPWLASLAPEPLRIHADGILSRSGVLWWIAAAASVQMALGLADDWRDDGLDYRFRLLVEIGLVALLATQGICLQLFFVPHWVAVLITVIWVVGLTNAINFLDNMDGLAAGVVFLASVFFAVVMALVGSLFVSLSFVIVAGAVLGFLWYNWTPARIFMGDAGSNFLGFWMGMLTVVGTFIVEPFSPVTIFSPLCILAVPMYDSISVIAIRLKQGRSPFQPDKQHFSHRLTALGLTKPHAVLLIYLVCVTTGLAGVLLYFLTPRMAPWVAPLVVLQVFCTLAVVALLEWAAHGKNGGGEVN